MPGPRRYDLRPDDVAALVGNEPAYRVKQIWEGLYEQARDIDEITSLPKALRAKLAAEPTFDMALDTELEKRSEHGETIKWLWSLIDGAAIETVLMHLVTSWLRYGVRVLRNRSGRIRTTTHLGRNNRTGDSCPTTLNGGWSSAFQCGLYGHGRTNG
jgi:hypothetical protein